MIYAVFLASLGTIASLVVFLFWQTRRAAASADSEIASAKRTGELELQLAARGRAVEDRDATISNILAAEKKRLDAAFTAVITQRDALVANIKDLYAAVDAIRDALRGAGDGGVSVPSSPTTKAPGTTTPR